MRFFRNLINEEEKGERKKKMEEEWLQLHLAGSRLVTQVTAGCMFPYFVPAYNSTPGSKLKKVVVKVSFSLCAVRTFRRRTSPPLRCVPAFAAHFLRAFCRVVCALSCCAPSRPASPPVHPLTPLSRDLQLLAVWQRR